MGSNRLNFDYVEGDFSSSNLSSRILTDVEQDSIDPLSFLSTRADDYSKESPASILRLLNYELAHLGYDPVFIDTNSKSTESLIRTLYSLVAQQHTNRSYCDDYEDRLRRVNSDYEKSRSSAERLKAKIETMNREVDSMRSKTRTLEQEFKTQTIKANQAKEELKYIKADYLFNKNQFAHDIRKKDVEINKVKDKVQKIVNEKYKTSKIGITELNPQSRPSKLFASSKQAFPSESAPEEKYYTELIQNYDDREKVYIRGYENISNNLSSFFNQIYQFIKTYSDDQNVVRLPSLQFNPDGIHGIPEAITQLVNMVKEAFGSLEAKTQNKNATNASTQTAEIARVSSSPDPELIKQIDDSKETINCLNNEIQELRNKLDRKDKEVLQRNEELQNMISEFSTIEQAKASLEKDQLALEQDRSRFTQASVLLNHERVMLQEEKASFSKEKDEFFAEKELINNQVTPEWLKGIDLNKINLNDSDLNLKETDPESLFRAGGKLFSDQKEMKSSIRQASLDSHFNLKSLAYGKSKLTKPVRTAHHMLPTAAALMKTREISPRQQKNGVKSQLSKTSKTTTPDPNLCLSPTGEKKL